MGKKSRRRDQVVKENPVNYKRLSGEPIGDLIKGFATDADCLSYCKDKYPNLPLHIIELGMEYCKKHHNLEAKWKNKPSINQKEITGAQRRRMKKAGTLDGYLARKQKYLDNFEPVINGAVKIYSAEDIESGKVPKWDKYIKGQRGDGRGEMLGDGKSGEDLHQFVLNGRIYNNLMEDYEEALKKYNEKEPENLNVKL
tara:strand:- start:5784 stop:6377 length:594 start_codon:yes stop_codon:yes gene_type:complete